MKKKVLVIITCLVATFTIFIICRRPPQDISKLIEEADTDFRFKDYKSCLPEYTELIKLDSSKRTYFFRRGIANVHQKNYQDAIADFKQCILMDSSGKEVYFNIAVAYKHLGFADSAITNLTKVLNFDSTDEGAKEVMEECELIQKIDRIQRRLGKSSSN